MDVRLAGPQDLPHVAHLLWLLASPEEQARQPVESFATDLAAWWTDRDGSHRAFVARRAEIELIGMVWLALVPRVPRPGDCTRLSADIQSLFVVPEHRGNGIGSALVRAAWEHASHLGAARVTVHSGSKAVPLYERLGFASSGDLLQRTDTGSLQG